MAKDTPEVEVFEQPSVRDSIIAAREEVDAQDKNREDDEVKRDDGPAREDKEDRQDKKEVKAKPVSKSESEPDDETTDDSGDAEPVVEEPKVSDKTEVKTKAPVGWTKEAKAEWAKLPEHVRASIAKREKEVSDGFAGTKQATERLREFDTVIAPHMPAIQQFGVSPAQTVGKLFEWFTVLSHPNKQVRQDGFKILAKNFGIDTQEFAPQRQVQDDPQQYQEPEQNNQNDSPPAWAQSLIERQQQLDGMLSTQKQQATQDYVNSWAYAKDAKGELIRPHYEKVRVAIAALIGQGVVPLEAGQITQDVMQKAYEKAIRVDDEVWAQVQEEQQEAAEAKKQAEAVKRAAAARAAKAKAVSIKPGAPTLNGAKSGKPNGKVSVRDSIDAAIKEAMG